jgi:hypothetical protein
MGDDLSAQFILPEDDLATRLDPPTRGDQCLPEAVWARGEEQYLGLAAAGVAVAAQARANDPCIVEDDDVLGSKKGEEVAEVPVLDLPATAMQDQHARGIARSRGILSDQLGWEVVVESRDIHKLNRAGGRPAKLCEGSNRTGQTCALRAGPRIRGFCV